MSDFWAKKYFEFKKEPLQIPAVATPSGVQPIAIDDWCTAGGSVYIAAPTVQGAYPKGTILCNATMKDGGVATNYIANAKTTGDAFLKCVEEVEKVIGKGWRKRIGSL
jgi:hypothetical protein